MNKHLYFKINSDLINIIQQYNIISNKNIKNDIILEYEFILRFPFKSLKKLFENIKSSNDCNFTINDFRIITSSFLTIEKLQ